MSSQRSTRPFRQARDRAGARLLERALPAALCAAAIAALLGAIAPAQAATGPRGSTPASGSALTPQRPPASASLEQCQTAASEAQRSATFAGEMSAVAGTQRMQMSVQVLERVPGESAYRMIEAPGLGVWRSSALGVQSYKYLRQITNLAAPAFYRAAIRFRWLGAHEKTIQTLELHTRRCEQTLPSEALGASS